MAGYDPTCNACKLCPRCSGKGTIPDPKPYDAPGGGNYYSGKPVTCPGCSGRGGSPCGKHP
jgi:hypothetical protein